MRGEEDGGGGEDLGLQARPGLATGEGEPADQERETDEARRRRVLHEDVVSVLIGAVGAVDAGLGQAEVGRGAGREPSGTEAEQRTLGSGAQPRPPGQFA